jgi:hypothetical protein
LHEMPVVCTTDVHHQAHSNCGGIPVHSTPSIPLGISRRVSFLILHLISLQRISCSRHADS